jgi:hypothetical protein
VTATHRQWIEHAIRPALVLVALLVGLLLSYRIWGVGPTISRSPSPVQAQLEGTLQHTQDQVNPPEGYGLGIAYADLGPRLVAAGALDVAALTALYAQSGIPLPAEEIRIWQAGSAQEIVITALNSRFVLNFLWAVGLANRNAILTSGPMQQYSEGHVERFASTGGWTLAGKPVSEIYASLELIPLSPDQQRILEDVASAVYRPCCDNPTHFPDCNHGMAMLGLLELLASQNATVARMFDAAKYANAYWFPQQAVETALYLNSTSNLEFPTVDGRVLTADALASASGFGALHQRLQASGLLPQQSGGSGSCAS